MPATASLAVFISLHKQSNADAQLFCKLFDKLGYRVRAHDRLGSANDFCSQLNQYRLHHHRGPFILFLSAQSSQAHAIQTSSGQMEWAKVLDMFDGHNCPSLVGKLKLIVCDMTLGLKRQDFGLPTTGKAGEFISFPQKEINLFGGASNPEPPTPQPVQTVIFEETAVGKSDFLILFTCFPGYVSWRTQGVSRAIRVLFEVFARHCHKHSVSEMIWKVRRKLCLEKTSTGAKQVVTVHDTLSNDFYI